MGIIGVTTREQIYSALWNLVSSATIPDTPPGVASQSPFVITSRLLVHWSKVPAEQQPALFMAQWREQPIHPKEMISGIPYTWLLSVKLWIYSQRAANDAAIIATSINPLLDAIINAIRNPEIGAPQTLGGLVKSVRMSGIISTDEGQLGSQAVAVVPVDILTAEL